MSDIDFIKIICKKTGREYEETSQIVNGRVGFLTDDNKHVIQLCMNDCNLMNETIPEELWKLKNLKKLFLSTNMISYFPEGILELKNLVQLELNANQIRIITGRIGELRNLEILNLAGNQLETLPLGIGKIRSLKRLRLNVNRIIVLPTIDPEREWLQLEALDLDGADMKEIPKWMFLLHSLKYLSLSKLHLNRFPESISLLSKLEGLYIDSTQFQNWPDQILLPDNMRFIVLDGAYLPFIPQLGVRRIPDAIVELKPRYVRNQKLINKYDMSLQVSLGGHISEGLDEKRLFDDNPEVSYKYLKSLYNTNKKKYMISKNTRLKDIKIMLLGAGAVGKSSLVQRLCLSNPDDDNIALESIETTHGVNLDYQMELHDIWDKTNKRFEEFTARFWDFGGQDKYRGINRLLLTDKGIYIIILDSRAQSLPDIWLEMVRVYAPNSRVILVANKIDENPRLNINFQYYCEQYPQLYNCLFKISCKYPNLGINKISDIFDAIKRIVEEQIDIIAPIGRIEWVKIQSEVEKQYHIHKKELLYLNDYSKICNSFGVIDGNEQSYLLEILSNCGSCLAIDGEEYSILNPNWLADYLYIFYNNSDDSNAIMDYKKEYIPMLRRLDGYSEYKELITDYLQARGLCTVFFNDQGVKKIFIPMFLSDTFPDIKKIHTDPCLKYMWTCNAIPEYEFQKFLVIEYSRFSEGEWYAWQYGLYFECDDWRIYLQLMNNGILLKIWTSDIEKCGKCLQWIRMDMLSIASDDFFNEYIIVEGKDGKALLPYNSLVILQSWNIEFYCLPAQEKSGLLIPINVNLILQKCGLRKIISKGTNGNLELLVKEALEQGGAIVNINIDKVKVCGDINNNEINGDNTSVFISQNNSEIAMQKAIHDLKNNIDSLGNDYEDLKGLLEELEKSKWEERKTIKSKIENWMSQFANTITIGSALYENKQKILVTIQHILNMLN